MKTKNESGIALIAVLLLLVLAGALLESFIISLNSDQKNLGSYLDESKAASRAQGVLTRIANQLAGEINAGRLNGDGAINAAAAQDIIARASAGSGLDASATTITRKVGSEVPKPRTLGASAGVFSGMSAIVHAHTIAVTGRDVDTGKELRYEQDVQIVYIPAFQFGMFSESDLSFFPGGTFDFGGRVHTNGNLYLGGTDLLMKDYASAAGNVLRGTKPNRLVEIVGGDKFNIKVTKGTTSTDQSNPNGNRDGNGSVKITKDGSPSNLTALGLGEGNETLKGSAWKPIYNRFNGYLSNGDPSASTVPAKTLNLPLVTADAQPIDLIRRPLVNSREDETNNALFEQRYFSQASLRILLSDTANEIQNLPTVGPNPVLMEGTYPTSSPQYKFAESTVASDYKKGSVASAGVPLIGGYIKIEMQTTPTMTSPTTTNWEDVTAEILKLGVHGKAMAGSCNRVADDATNAIIRVQRFADDITNTTGCNAATITGTNAARYWPNVLFDTREAVDNDTNADKDRSGVSYGGKPLLGGLMHYVELDINNLGRWLRGEIGTNGTRAIVHDTGYVVYFSDRRGSGNNPTYNYENAYDHTNTRVDINGDGVINTTPVQTTNYRTITNDNYTLNTTVSTPMTGIDTALAKRVRPVYFRRALKLANGQKINLGYHTTDTNVKIPYGLSIASENPVYVQGNYNATKQADLTTPLEVTGGNWTSVPASIVADAVTMLSVNWKDSNSFSSPYVRTGRKATTTFYRTAIISGKNKNFVVNNAKDYGTDGGAHNFFRMIEDWSGQTFWYRGSIVSLYYSQEAMSSFKSNAGNVYDVPTRQFSFDTEFLNFEKLPPRTPMFRDINRLGFTRVTKASAP
jgi:hypothetical protein